LIVAREQLYRFEIVHHEKPRSRARYDADLAERRYETVDPGNRLIAGTLEHPRCRIALRVFTPSGMPA
jgi:hypothetical protein